MAFLYIISLFLLVCYIILLAYYHNGFIQLNNYENTSIKGTTKITIIIPARNEEDTITNCLQSIANQTYPKQLTQVIVVNDFSTDKTAEKVAAFQNVTLLNLHDFIKEGSINSYKKKGIEIAIKNATGELIICTDADCTATINWVSNIVSFYENNNTQFIAAPVQLVSKNKIPKFVEIFQTLDFAILQGITAASVFKNFHTMCNGANVAYTKKAFDAVNGFKGIDSIATGDDMLLMHKIKKAFSNQIHYLKSKEAIVQSLTVTTWKSFFSQRIRWASKATHYEDKNIFYSLLIVYFLNVVSLILFIILFFQPQNFIWTLLFLSIKTIVEFWFLKPVLQFFEQSYLIKWYFFCIPFHIVYTVIAGWLGKFGSHEWKGRQLSTRK